jgi:hypothetical protein
MIANKQVPGATGARSRALGREPPFREDFSTEAEEWPLLEPLPGNY